MNECLHAKMSLLGYSTWDKGILTITEKRVPRSCCRNYKRKNNIFRIWLFPGLKENGKKQLK